MRRWLGCVQRLPTEVRKRRAAFAVLWINISMSPTIFREGGFRFYFFSREEPRMHVHVQGQNGEAKFWLEPTIELAQHTGLSRREIAEALRLVQERENDIGNAWRKHFGC